MLFEALLWSDFTSEREYFFIGGLEKFSFIAIHDVVRQKNYSPFILPMTMLQRMIRGFPYKIGAITALNVQSLKLLISNCLCRTTSCSRTGVYINKLFRNLTNNVRRVEFNGYWMNRHEESSKYGRFGYRLLKPLFFTDCGSTEEVIDFSLIFRLFSNKLETVIVENIPGPPFRPSISLNDAFHRSLVKGLEIVSSSPRLSKTFKEIIVIEPKGDLDGCIDSLHQVVGEKGFKMEKGSYFHSKRGAKSDKCLFVKRNGQEWRPLAATDYDETDRYLSMFISIKIRVIIRIHWSLHVANTNATLYMYLEINLVVWLHFVWTTLYRHFFF